MRKLLLSAAILFTAGLAQAQTFTADFESLPLAGSDTFYINKVNPLTDAGFDNGMLHFPYVYDSSFGGYWTGGFAYSNKTDSVTSGARNMYSAKAGKGANGSSNYTVFSPGYGDELMVRLTSRQKFAPQSVAVTNSTYAYNSMRDGDGFAKKFGGVSGNDSDWFRLTIYGWAGGQRKPDSVNVFLADFCYSNSALDYLVKDWRTVTLSPLGIVDSLSFSLSSSDTGAFGMNTPAYFCMDNMRIFLPNAGVPAVTSIARAYPNPVVDVLNVELLDQRIRNARILDMSGRVLGHYDAANGTMQIPTAGLTPGTYVLQLDGSALTGSIRFTKR